jgi:hypothetical protein
MKDLASIYAELRQTSVEDDLATKLSAPLLLNPSPKWWAAEHRLLVVGQETLDWGFKEGEHRLDPAIRIKSWADFMGSGHPVQRMMEFYSQFSFAMHSPGNRKSPFWQAFRELAEAVGETGRDPDSSVLWTNIFRAAYDGGSVLYAPHNQRTKMLAFSQGVFLAELAALEPSAVVFFTGPRYDFALSTAFDGLERDTTGHFPERALCTLKHPALPALAWRSYHPGYLSRAGKWGIVSYLAEQLRSHAAT